jgi:hypothetical protein
MSEKNDPSIGSDGVPEDESIQMERDRAHLRDLLLEGASSPLTEPIDSSYFDTLRRRISYHTTDN